MRVSSIRTPGVAPPLPQATCRHVRGARATLPSQIRSSVAPQHDGPASGRGNKPGVNAVGSARPVTGQHSTANDVESAAP